MSKFAAQMQMKFSVAVVAHYRGLVAVLAQWSGTSAGTALDAIFAARTPRG